MQKTYDQFVWVPVENAVLYLSTEYATLDETQIKTKVQEQIDLGKYPMAIKTDGTNYIGVLYGFNEKNNAVKVTPYLNWTPKSTMYREPSTVVDYDVSSNLQEINGILNTNYSDATSFGTELQSQFNTMVTKVQNAGGFWIGRYETSNMQSNQVSAKRGTTTGINNVTWYRMYARQSLYSELAIVNDQTSKTSSMIWGSQWDQVMIWMKNIENDKENTRGKYYVTNGAGKGNYGTISGVTNDTFSGVAPTGSLDEYAEKNIFDLSGNVYEWTLENHNTYNRVIRGGVYIGTDTGYTRPSCRSGSDNYPTISSSYRGSRLTLY